MNRAYQGKDEKGRYQQFEWDRPEEPTEESTGLTDIEEVGSSTI